MACMGYTTLVRSHFIELTDFVDVKLSSHTSPPQKKKKEKKTPAPKPVISLVKGDISKGVTENNMSATYRLLGSQEASYFLSF